MLKYLLDLADYLDRKRKVREANVIDVFIRKVAQEETWGGNNATPVLNFEYRKPNNQNQDLVTLTDGEGTALNLREHPLGVRAVKLVKGFFINSDPDQEVKIENLQAQIQGLAVLAIRYDEYLQYYKDPEENPNPITPAQLQEILNGAFKLVNREYQSGNPDIEFVRDSIATAYKYYEDYYLKYYMHYSDSDQAYINPAANELGPISELGQGALEEFGGELTPDQFKELSRKNEQETQDWAQQIWREQIEEELEPDLAQKRRDIRREKMKKDYPEEWHSVLFQ